MAVDYVATERIRRVVPIFVEFHPLNQTTSRFEFERFMPKAWILNCLAIKFD